MADHLLHAVVRRGIVHCGNCPVCFGWGPMGLTAKYHFTISEEEAKRQEIDVSA